MPTIIETTTIAGQTQPATIDQCGQTLLDDKLTVSFTDPAWNAAARYDVWWSSDYSGDIDAATWNDPFSSVTFPSQSGTFAQFTGLPTNGEAITLRINKTADGDLDGFVVLALCEVTAYTSPSGGPIDWNAQGYTSQFAATPAAGDIGGNVDAWMRNTWNNGGPVITGAFLDAAFENAPDGNPALRISSPPNTTEAFNYRARQLPDSNTDLSVVYSVEIWIDESTDPGLSYFGPGHYWGSQDGITSMPSGGNQRSDSWSARLISGLNSRIMSIYYYPSDSAAPNGVTKQGSQNRNVSEFLGRWVLWETEIIMNNPASSANGILRGYADGDLVVEATGVQIRNDSDCYPKGMGHFVRDNNAQNATAKFFYRNWEIRTRAGTS